MNQVSNITLRRDQETVFVDANDFIKESKEASKPTFGRIIMPPRTGKTVIAGEIIASTGAHTTYLVPSIDLVDQTVSALRAQLPCTEIGYSTKTSSRYVDRGVNVMTYQMAQTRYRTGELDGRVTSAELVFADEAHVTMTELRMDLLRNAFDVRTPRIGLTATPDYNEQRTLASHFPTLIHEVELTEAVELGLLAPFRWWLMEVDVDASNVRIIGDDYDQGELGRVMTNTALFNAVMLYRSSQAYDDTGTLICCKSRDQAYALERYLAEHAQAEKVRARAILHETSPSDRHEFRRQFDCGEINNCLFVTKDFEYSWDEGLRGTSF
jgi:superfamily II DNA or RNA helicase